MLLLIYALVGAYLAACTAEALVHALGFDQTGIRNNSIAATWQSKWRNPANKNDLFAKLQSGGTSGFPGHYNVYFGLIGFMMVVFFAEMDVWA
ncbi:hypothetical protein MRX96_023657 [Rhipicephalus microplus]